MSIRLISLLIVKEKLRKSPGKLGFSHAGGSKEKKGTNGPFFI